jgi:hypothetical protein
MRLMSASLNFGRSTVMVSLFHLAGKRNGTWLSPSFAGRSSISADVAASVELKNDRHCKFHLLGRDDSTVYFESVSATPANAAYAV